MNAKRTKFPGASLALVALLASSTITLANQVAGVMLTGRLTAITGGEYVSVDGHQYHIQSGSQAAQAVRTLSTGQLVSVVLSGPAASSGSEVIGISVRTGP